MSVLGRSIQRHDAQLQVTGRSKYGADIDMPDMLWCVIKRSDRAHANILRIDTSAAERLPGVAAVITAKDMANNHCGYVYVDQTYFAEDKVRGYGDAIAAVAAETEEIAQEACRLIEVDYEDLPGVFSIQDALKEDAPVINGGSGDNIVAEVKVIQGDTEQGFAESDFIFEQTFTTPAIEHAMIEPHAGIAYVDDNGDMVVRTSTQRASIVVNDVANATNRPINRTRVICSAVGGGFGGKNEYTFEPMIAVLAERTNRPVKCVYTREEEFTASTVRHPYVETYRTGVRKDGKIMAREVKIYSDCGGYITLGKMTLNKAVIHACGPYEIPHTKVVGYLVYTNNSVGGAMRGFGLPQTCFAYECHTDYIAQQLNMDPIQFRRLNLIHDGAHLPTGMRMNVVTLEETLDKAIEMARRGGDLQ